MPLSDDALKAQRHLRGELVFCAGAVGHATIEMTMRDSHLSPDVRRRAVQMLDRHDNTVATQAAPRSEAPTLQ